MDADFFDLAGRAVLASSIALLVVLALRAPVRRAFGARVAYAFWLLAPVITIAALLPARRLVVKPESMNFSAAVPGTADPAIAPAPDAIAALPSAGDFTPVLVGIWLAGAVACLVMLVMQQRRLMSVIGMFDARDGAQFAVAGFGPAVIGVIAPRIVLPADFAERYTAEERQMVLEHERAHIRAGDLQVNAMASLVQCLMWFNPVVHVARRALRIDQEFACDERVMRRFGGARRVYAQAMLKAQLPGLDAPLVCAWPGFGRGALKRRIELLGRPEVGVRRRALGAGFCAVLAVAGGLGAWFAQPARIAFAAEQASPKYGPGFALVEALKNQDIDDARRLIRSGADVNHWSEGDGTPLVLAARLGDPVAADAMVRELLRAGADVNRAAPGEGNALIVAAARGEIGLVRTLVSAGADVNAVVPSDETPLINAARNGHLDVARFLIGRGANVNLYVDAPTDRGTERRSPLSMARRGGHADMVELLRRAGARD